MARDPFSQQRRDLRLKYKNELNAQPKKKTLFEDRPSNNMLGNALKDIQDFGTGISTVVSSIPSFVKGDVKAPTPKQLGKAILKGYAESYGQQEGVNPGALAQSFVKHPLNILDVVPAASLIKGGKLAGAVSKAGKAGKAFDNMGAIGRNTGKFIIKDPLALKSVGTQATKADDFIKFATKSGANQYGKGFKGAGEMKGIKSLTPGQQHTFSYIYSQKGITPEIVNKVKEGLGVKSLKEVPDAQLADLVDKIRAEIPVAKATTDVSGKRLVQGARTKEFQPKTIPAMRQVKKAFTGAVLTRPSWVTGNRVGDATFALMSGKNPAELYQKGFSSLTKDMVNPRDLGGFYKGAAKDVAQEVTTPLGKIDKAWNDAFFGFEGMNEQATRRGAFYKNLEEPARMNLIKKGQLPVGGALKDEVQRLSKIGPFYDQAVKKTRQEFGDFRDFDSLGNLPMPDFAKQVAGEVLASPFIKYGVREVPKIMAHNVVNHPFITAGQRAVGQLGNQFQDQQGDYLNQMGFGVPEYARGGFVRGMDETGRPEIFNAGKLLPQAALASTAKMVEKFPSIEALGAANPVVTLPHQIATGTDFTGRAVSQPNVVQDYNSRRYFIDPATQDVSPLNGTELAPTERLPFLASQLLRNFTKAGSLEQWMPQKTYGSRIFQPDKTQPSKPSDYILQNLGFGNIQKAAPTNVVDEQRIRDRYINKLVNP